MKQRIITALIMAVLLIPLVVLGGYFTLALALFLSYVAGYELIDMFSKKHPSMKKYRYLFPLYSVLIVLANYFVVNNLFEFDYKFLLLLILGVFVSIFLICLRDSSLKMSYSGLFIVTFFYSGLCVACLTSIRYITTINDIVSDARYLGLFLIIYLCVSTMTTDAGAYFVGIKFGKHKLCPLISPKKTVEGAIGGVLGCVIASLILYAVFVNLVWGTEDANYIAIALMAAFLSVVSMCGDLTASVIKRNFEIKDFGKLIPGHGGVLDRFDSIIFVLTALYAIINIFGVVI
jgi:phosphatidate cytidylyltransferase